MCGEAADGWSEWQDVHVCKVGSCSCEVGMAERGGRRRCGVGVAGLALLGGTAFRVRLRGRNAAGEGEVAEVAGVTDEKRAKLTAAPPPPEWRGIDLRICCAR